jgi:hypothetical protein
LARGIARVIMGPGSSFCFASSSRGMHQISRQGNWTPVTSGVHALMHSLVSGRQR